MIKMFRNQRLLNSEVLELATTTPFSYETVDFVYEAFDRNKERTLKVLEISCQNIICPLTIANLYVLMAEGEKWQDVKLQNADCRLRI